MAEIKDPENTIIIELKDGWVVNDWCVRKGIEWGGRGVEWGGRGGSLRGGSLRGGSGLLGHVDELGGAHEQGHALVERGRRDVEDVALAVGRLAQTALGVPYVRHPSHGGASAFRVTLAECL